jgi:hypothetical protein
MMWILKVEVRAVDSENKMTHHKVGEVPQASIVEGGTIDLYY